MTNRKWTDDEVKAEIREAVRIVTEDREKATYATLHEKYGNKDAPNPDDSKDGDKSKSPPRKEGEPEPDLDRSKQKRSLFWGDQLNE
jgi:hypothetical protein